MSIVEEHGSGITFYMDRLPEKSERNYALILLEKGYIKLSINDEPYHCVAPAILCFNDKQRWEVVAKQDLMVCAACFAPAFLCSAFTSEYIDGCSTEYLCENFDFLMMLPFVSMQIYSSVRNLAPQSVLHQARILCAECAMLLKSNDRLSRCRGRSKFIDCLHLCEQLFAESEHIAYEPLVGKHIPEKYKETREALQLIHADYGNAQINAAYILDKLHVNKEKLNQQFREVTGCSIYQYILQYRLTMARHKLIFTEDTVDAISESCGFTTYVTLATIFKKKVGVSPQTYRLQERSRRKKNLDPV